MPPKRSASIAKKFTTPFAGKTARRRRSNPRIFRVSERSPPRRNPRRKISRKSPAFNRQLADSLAAVKMVPKDRNRRKRIRALSSHQSWRIGMARINTNVSALTAQRGLAKSQRQLSDTLQRLSSGLKINRGADDPAGLIASEGLRSEIAGIDQAIDNS